jgi:hypothetical protein
LSRIGTAQQAAIRVGVRSWPAVDQIVKSLVRQGCTLTKASSPVSGGYGATAGLERHVSGAPRHALRTPAEGRFALSKAAIVIGFAPSTSAMRDLAVLRRRIDRWHGACGSPW